MATCEQKVIVVSTHSKANQSGLKGKMHQQRSSTKQETVSNLLYKTNGNCKTELGVKIKNWSFSASQDYLCPPARDFDQKAATWPSRSF